MGLPLPSGLDQLTLTDPDGPACPIVVFSALTVKDPGLP